MRGDHLDDLVVDATATRQHLHVLLAAGWSRRSIAGTAGVCDTIIGRIAAGQDRCLIAVADRITAIRPASLPTGTYRGSDPRVPKTGTVRRIEALLAIGWTHAHIEELAGIHTGVILAKKDRRLVLRSTRDTIAAAYAQLARTPGPSAITRRRARALGYLSPAAWDDIDHDPTPEALTVAPLTARDVDEVVVERVLAGEALRCNIGERREVVRRWPTTGRSLADLERLTGWKVERYHQADPEVAA